MNTPADTNTRKSFWKALGYSCGTERDRRNQLVFTVWVLGWGVTWIAALLWIKTYETSGALLWVIAALPMAFAAGALYYYLRFLRQTDELVRRIQLEGLAFGFGIGVFYMMAQRVFEMAGATQPDISDATAVMFVAWGVGIALGTWRYR